MIKLPTIEEMFEAGVHFGHKKERSHPRSKKFVFTIRNGIFVINLEKTLDLLKEAMEYLSKISKEGKTILFVGTKRQTKKIVEEVAKKCGMPYVSYRWLGGTLTNFETVRKSIKHLEELEKEKESEEYKVYTKKEKLKLDEEITKLHQTFDGILEMKNMPDCLFVVDAAEEDNAINEARIKEIPVVAVCDTNANPNKVDFPIPANDEAAKSIEMMVNLAQEAILDSKNK